MTGTHDEADYLSVAPHGSGPRPAWLRLGLPMAAIFLLAGAGAAAIGLMTERLYEAEARVELIVPDSADPQTMPLPEERIASARSSSVATRVVNELILLEDARFLDAHPAVDAEGMPEHERLTRAAAAVLRNIDTVVEEEVTFATISYRSPDPVLAADIASAITHAFVTEDAEQVAGALGDSREELETLIAEIRGELETAERALAEDMSEADILALPAAEAELVATDGNDALTEEARIALSTELNLVRADLDRVETAIAGGEFDPTDPVIARLQDSRAALEEEYQRVTEQFRADYPAAQRLRERIEAVDASLSREALRLAEDRAAEQAQLTIRENELLAQLAQLGSEVEARGAAGEGLGTLQEDVVAKRELYSLLLARLALAENDERPTTARVIGEADVPTAPVTPNWYLLIGLALGAALLLSGLLVWRDRRKLGAYY